MAFVKKTWKDRISEFPNRRTVNDGYVTKQVTVGRDEGTITEAGDSFDASNMNDLEQRIEDAYGDVQALVGDEVAAQYNQENVIFDPVATPGHGTGFVVSSDYIANLTANDLKDVNITSPSQGEALVFDNDGNLVNGTPSLDVGDLDDVTITTPTDGEILVYNNGVWENQANPASTQNFAPDYDDTQTYNTNDKVIYQGLLYICLEDSVTGAWDGTKWQNITVADYNAELLPIESGSSTDTKSYIDSGLSGKQNKSILNIVKTYGSGSSTDALDNIVAEYGTNNMMFAFEVPLGFFTGVMNFYSSSVGSGFLIQSATSRLWVLYYLNGAWTLTEKT